MDLEDARKRLQSPDASINARCVARLLDVIKKKKHAVQPIATDSNQIPEILLLWEMCGNESLTSSALIVDGLLSLIWDGSMQFEYAVKKFTNVAAKAKNVVAIVSALTKLLIHNINQIDEAVRINYSLQYPKHPFILILESRTDVWSVILQNVMGTLSTPSDRINNFTMIEPVINYILFCPSKHENVSSLPSMRSSLLSELWFLGQNHPTEVVKYLCEILPFLQMRDRSEMDNVSNVISYLRQLLPMCKSLDGIENYVQYALLCALAVSSECMKHNLSPFASLDAALMLSSYITVEMRSLTTDACFFLLSVMLEEGCPVTLPKVIGICKALLDKIRPSRFVSAFLMIPLIQLLSNPKTAGAERTTNLSALFRKLESHFKSPVERPPYHDEKPEMFHFTAFNSTCSYARLCAGSIRQLEQLSAMHVIGWMNHLKTMIANGHPVTICHFHHSAVLLVSFTGDQIFLESCLGLLEAICIKQPLYSTKMLSLLLYKQSCETEPVCIQMIMEYLPKTVTHKYAVGPVLSVLQLMSKKQTLKPQAIYLMLELWRKQERCFPHLQKMLVEEEGSVAFDTGICEVRLSQSSAIKELCILAPERYGAEFLKALSVIINKSSSDSGTPAILLALDSIYHLCKSEALDLRSSWKTLAPKLSKDKRSLVLGRMCRFLSLAPQLKVNSFQYAKFTNEIAAHLWRVISLSALSPAVVGEAFKALSHFPLECHNLKDIPKDAKANLKLPPSMMATPFEAAKQPEDVLTYIPSYCFVDYIKSTTNEAVLEGYEKFLQAIIEQEVADLPRGVYSQRKIVGKRHSDVLSKIPGMLCSQYSVKKSFSGKKNLAVGILLSYEPPVEVDKDGKPLRHSLASHLGNYEQMLEILINEVNLNCNDWLCCVLLPHAWAAFMERMLFGCEESRRAELKIQKSTGHLKVSNEDFFDLLNTTWLWVRDRILERIRLNASNSSSATANAVFAVSGLVWALEKLHAGLDDKAKQASDVCQKFLNHDSFQIMCTESIISVFNPEHRPSSKILGWLINNLSKQSTSAGNLIRGCAGASLCNLHITFVKVFADKIHDTCQLFLQNLSGDSPNALNLYSGLGLGLFTQVLSQEGFFEGSVEKANYILEVAESVKRSCSVDDPKCGNLLALAIITSSLSKSGNHVHVHWVRDTCTNIQERLLKERADSVSYDYLSVCISCMLVSACAANIAPLEEAKELSSWFLQKTQDNPQCSSSAIALGILLDALVTLGDSKSEDTLEVTRKIWITSLASEKEPTLKRLAALTGLCSLYSAGRNLIKLNEGTRSAEKIYGLKDLVQLLLLSITNTKDNMLQNVSSWELGNLFAVNNRYQTGASIIPSNYSYLSDRSILKPLIQFISESVENGESCQVNTALGALNKKFSRPLPPLNWTTFLTPFLQRTKDVKLTETCLRIALHQMPSATTALSIVSSYATPPILQSLPENCQLLLLESIPVMVTSLLPSTLKAFLNCFVSGSIEDNAICDEKGIIALQVILGCYESVKTNQNIVAVLDNTFLQMFEKLSRNSEIFMSHLSLLTDILAVLSNESQNLIVRSLEEGNLDLIFIVYCNLVIRGAKSLSSLKPFLESGKQASPEVKNQMVLALLKCFSQGCICSESDVSKAENCLTFLMETIGWIIVLSDPKAINTLEDIPTVVSFLYDICFAVIVGSSGYKVCYALWRTQSHVALLEALPSACFLLIQNPTWEESMDKITSWLQEMILSSYFNTEHKVYIQAALCALRYSKCFQKPSIWTSSISRPILSI